MHTLEYPVYWFGRACRTFAARAHQGPQSGTGGGACSYPYAAHAERGWAELEEDWTLKGQICVQGGLEGRLHRQAVAYFFNSLLGRARGVPDWEKDRERTWRPVAR